MANMNSRESVLIGMLVTVLGSLAVWLIMGHPSTGIDDADIFFVYARNFAAGHGFVYNVGGEAVEGFTSMLWTLLCSGIAGVFESPELPAYILNVVFGTVTLSACMLRAKRPLVFLLMLAMAPAWFAWSQVALMETGLWCMLVTLLVLAVAEQRRNAVLILLPLLVLTRPESMLWGAWIVLVYALGKKPKSSVLPILVFVLSVLILVCFRIWYFGYPVPNTYYAKVSTNLLSNIMNGVVYFGRYLMTSAFVVFALLLWARVLKNGLSRKLTELHTSTRIALCLLPGLGIPILVGGDHFGSARFYQPIWPLLCLLAANEWSRLSLRMNKRRNYAVLGLFLLLGWVAFPFVGNLKHEFRIAQEGREKGVALAQMFQDLEHWPTVAVITAGGTKLTYPGTVFDLMGLNATEMAHAAGDRTGYKNHTAFNRDIFYWWKPDILLCGDSQEFDALVLNGLHTEPRFLTQYTQSTLYRNGAALQAYYRNEFLMQIPSLGNRPEP